MTKERLLPKGKMITNSKGVSYYQRGNKYYSNTGWLEREISYELFEKDVNNAKGSWEFIKRYVGMRKLLERMEK